jgi:hypothetical protein
MYKIVTTHILIIFISGCASLDLREVSPTPQNQKNALAHEFKSSADLQYLSCDSKSWFVENNGDSYGTLLENKKEWASSMHALPQKHLKAAIKSSPYAVMANNVYRSPSDKPILYLPNWKVVSRHESTSGLALEELHKIESGSIQEVVVVYKGTDGPSLKDWKANLSIWFEPNQYAEAQEYMKKLLMREDLANVPLNVVGHSLGGGIALNVSLRQSTVERPIGVFVFNTSPRAFYAPIDESIKAERNFLDEKGEFLGGARPFWHSKINKYDPLTYNFLDFTTTSKPVSEHSIYLFARALLLASIGGGDAYSKYIFKENFDIKSIGNQLPSLDHFEYDKGRDMKLCSDLLI